MSARTILIGREPTTGRLTVAENGRTATHGQKDSVPLTVSRYRPTEDTAHCRLDIDDDGVMRLTNLNPRNVTLVDGLRIESKRVTADAHITLGADGYSIDIASILAAADAIEPEAYPITHLERVWDTYHDGLLAIRLRQRRIGLIRGVAPLFTLGAGALAMLSRQIEGWQGITAITAALFVAGLVVMLVGFLLSTRDKGIEDGERLAEEFQSAYTCPHCHRFMGNTPYRLLRQTPRCPHCGCALTDKEG